MEIFPSLKNFPMLCKPKSVKASWHPDKGVCHFGLHFLAKIYKIWVHLWSILLTNYNSYPYNRFGICSIQAMTMAATLPIVWTRKTTRLFSLLLAWCCICNLISQSRSMPRLGESSLVAEALADARNYHEERLHNNQPEWTRGIIGVQPDAMAQQVLNSGKSNQCA